MNSGNMGVLMSPRESKHELNTPYLVLCMNSGNVDRAMSRRTHGVFTTTNALEKKLEPDSEVFNTP